jgi:hypothetical protein
MSTDHATIAPPTADELEAALPTDEEVARYRETGVYLSRPILPAAVLDDANRGMERFYAGDHDHPFPGTTRYDDFDWTPADGDGLRKNDYARMQVDELHQLVTYPLIGAVAARLAGVEQIRLWHDQLLYKPPQSGTAPGTVGWHTDRQYWTMCTSEQMLTAWVPLVDVDRTIGTVAYAVGSHRWSDEQLAGFGFFGEDTDEQQERFSAGRDVEILHADLERGRVAFHHCRTLHGSGHNLGDRIRRSVAIHLQPGDNRHQDAPSTFDDGLAYHRNDDLVRRGPDDRPDYTDPDVCPTLWPVG